MNFKTRTMVWWGASLCLLSLVGCGKGGGEGAAVSAGAVAASGAASAAAKPPQVVSLYTVVQKDMPVTVEVAGTVVPLNTVEVRAQLASTVQSVHVKDGQMVRKGDLLFNLDDRTDRANLDKARAQLLRDKATLADLERQLKRAQDLLAQNFISPGAVDSLRTQVEAQRALLAADEAAVRASETSLSYASLRSPLSGRAGQVNVNPGSYVAPTTAATTPALVTISQMDPIGVSFAVPESQLAALLRGGDKGEGVQGGQVTVLLPASGPARGPNAPARESLQGKVSFIDNLVDTASGTIRVKAELANPQQQLWPGQYVTARLTLRTLKDVAVVPQAALILRGQERSVYVVDADMKVSLRSVQVRAPQGELIAVEGLQAGERIVVEGKQNLRPGNVVREAPAGSAKPASGTSSGAEGAASAASGVKP